MNSVADFKERTMFCRRCANGWVKADRATMRDYVWKFGLKFPEIVKLLREAKRTGECPCPDCGGGHTWQEKY